MTLVSYDRYVEITGDSTSDEDAVDTALADAQGLIEERYNRLLESEERTERLRIHGDGRVYPSAIPVTEADGYSIEGFSLTGASPTSLSDLAGLFTDPDVDDYADVTYTGGYTEDTVPKNVERAIAYLAQSILPANAENALVTAGATSLSLGDASVSYSKPREALFPDHVKQLLQGFKRTEY